MNGELNTGIYWRGNEMNLPYKSLGIELNGYRLTKKQLNVWTSSNTTHVVPLFTGGGIFTSKGDGIYESSLIRFNSVDEFWDYAKKYKNIVMWEGE